MLEALGCDEISTHASIRLVQKFQVKMNWSNRIVISCILVEMNSFQVGHRTTRANRISSFPFSRVNFILFQLYYFYVAFTLAGHVFQKVNIFFCSNQLL